MGLARCVAGSPLSREEVLADTASRLEKARKVLRLRLSENMQGRESFLFAFAQDDVI
jgi:ribosome-binding factor A